MIYIYNFGTIVIHDIECEKELMNDPSENQIISEVQGHTSVSAITISFTANILHRRPSTILYNSVFDY